MEYPKTIEIEFEKYYALSKALQDVRQIALNALCSGGYSVSLYLQDIVDTAAKALEQQEHPQ